MRLGQKGNVVLRAKLKDKWPPAVGTFVTVGVYRPGNKRCQSEHNGEIVRVSDTLRKEVAIKVLGGEVTFSVESGLRNLYARVST